MTGIHNLTQEVMDAHFPRERKKEAALSKTHTRGVTEKL